MNAVLVVDDDDDWRMLLSMCFEDAGFAVRGGRNVQEGIAALTAGGIDVLVSDYMLPDGNGLDLLAGGRPASLRYAALLTGMGTIAPSDVKAAGFDAHYVKPVDALALVRSVRAHVHDSPAS